MVTVEHGQGRTTLAMPDDLAVDLLLPLIVSACGADGTATWTLQPRGARPLDGERSLREAGVWQGAILVLRQTGPGERPAPRTARPGQAGARAPAPPTVERLPAGHRLGLTLRAARDAVPRAAPQGAIARARAAWRDSGHLARLEETIAAAPRRRGVVIAVTSLATGCGKTTAAVLLASLLARARSQPPLVVDGDLASRALTRQLAPNFRMAPGTYLDVVERRVRLADLRPAPIGAYGIRLLPAPDHPAEPPATSDCAALIADLRAAWGLTVLDCAAGFATPWGRAAWTEADQFVLVARDAPADLVALEKVASALGGAGTAVVVVANRARSARGTAPPSLRAPVAVLPEDGVAAALLGAGELAWDATPEAWRRAIAGATAALAERW